MVSIRFPGLTIPEVEIKKGRFLNITLFGVGIKVPPVDITILPETTIWNGFKLFDTDWIVDPIKEWAIGIPWWVWDACKVKLDEWAEDFYKRRGAEKK